MKRIIIALLALCSIAAQATEQSVVLISIDGFRHDYIERHDAKHIRQIAQSGVRAEGLIPVYPSKTFPNHLSIVTGQYPSNHGIVDNNFYDTEREQYYRMGDGVEDSTWLTTLPIWNLAEFQGVKAATFFWPESSARINGRTPSYFYNYSTPTPNRQRIDQIVEWLKLPDAARPRLVTGYFSVVDTMGHRFGPLSQQVKGAVQHIDKLIGELWHRLKTEVDVPVNLILVSDHGMTTIEADKMIAVSSLPIESAQFEVVNSQTRLLLYAKPDTSRQQISQQREALAAHSKQRFIIESEQHLKALNVQAGPRKPDIILTAQAPVTFTNKPPEKRTDGGTHGFYGNRDMDGIFIAAGPAINADATLERFVNIHIYPFMAEILGIELMAPIDGKREVLAPLLQSVGN